MKAIITFISCFLCLQHFASIDDVGMPGSFAEESEIDSMKVRITIATRTFTATLYDNATVSAFKSKLPMTIKMRDLNANEKYFDLPDSLPTDASNPGKIQTGDLMLYGSSTLVLFYKSFSTSYSYTRIGRIEDVSGLAAALNSADVSVTFDTVDKK